MINALALFFLFFTLTEGTPARTFQGCGLASDKVYCYGGYTGFEPNTFVYTPSTSDFITIDIAKFDFTAINSTTDYWTPVPRPNNFNLEPNAGVIATSISNKTKLYLTGGFGESNTLLVNSTIIYDPSTNDWTTVPNTLPFYASSGQAIDLGDSQLFSWGGQVNNTGTIVPNQINVLNYATLQWSSAQVTGNVAYDYTATLVPGGRIYIIGGAQGTPLNDTGYYTSMTVVSWFDTVSNTWGYDNATGTNVVPRKYHTADLIPGTSKILIYGGVQNTETTVMPVSDFCYIYDYKAKAYTPIAFQSSGAGPRAGHSSVLYQTPSTAETYLFILFGYDSNVKLRNDTWVMNLTDTSQPEWTVARAKQASDDSTSSNALSTGAIVGISIGSAIAGIGLAAFAVIWFFRKRKQRQEFEIEQADPRHHQSMDGDRLGHGPHDMGEVLSTSQPMTSVTTDSSYAHTSKIEMALEDGLHSPLSDSTKGPLLTVTKPHGID
ncbi:unnamed protein product [Absidia cylindrospora]